MILLTTFCEEDRQKYHLFEDEQCAKEKFNKLVEYAHKTLDEIEDKMDEIQAWYEVHCADYVKLSGLVFDGKEYLPAKCFLVYDVYNDKIEYT